jgi:hypothetical protein
MTGPISKAKVSDFPQYLYIFQAHLHPSLILPIVDHRKVAVLPQESSVSTEISRKSMQ